MDINTIDALIAKLTPQEIDRLPWMMDVAIWEGWMDEAEAEVWRARTSGTANEIVNRVGPSVPQLGGLLRFWRRAAA